MLYSSYVVMTEHLNLCRHPPLLPLLNSTFTCTLEPYSVMFKLV